MQPNYRPQAYRLFVGPDDDRRSLVRHTLEEAHEVLAEIDRLKPIPEWRSRRPLAPALILPLSPAVGRYIFDFTPEPPCSSPAQ